MRQRALYPAVAMAVAVLFSTGAMAADTVSVEAGVTVIRGQSPEPLDLPETDETASGPMIFAGRNLWSYDPDDDSLSVCFLQFTTQLGEREIGCVGDGHFAVDGTGFTTGFLRSRLSVSRLPASLLIGTRIGF